MARYAIWYHLYNWKNVKNSLRGPKACNFTKSNIDPWVFFIFFKLHKWYQIAQRISYIWDQFSIEFLDFFCFFFFFFRAWNKCTWKRTLPNCFFNCSWILKFWQNFVHALHRLLENLESSGRNYFSPFE